MSTSIKTLEALCKQINKATGSPLTPYTRTESGLTANIGNFHLSEAYGGICVHRMHNADGGITEAIWGGHISKAKAETKMRGYLAELEMAQGRDIDKSAEAIEAASLFLSWFSNR